MLFCLVALFTSSLTASPHDPDRSDPGKYSARNLSLMRSHIGERETRGVNRSPFIDSVNRFVGNPLGAPYCAATASWCNARAGVVSPKPSGLAIRLRTSSSWSVIDVLNGRVRIEPGDLTVWQVGNTMHGHVGIAELQISRSQVWCCEANTSCRMSADRDGPSSDAIDDDREGDGICEKLRTLRRYCHFGIKYITRPVYADSKQVSSLRSRGISGSSGGLVAQALRMSADSWRIALG
jgi:hypothetical protein